MATAVAVAEVPGMFDDASSDDDELAPVTVSGAVAAGLPTAGSTTQQPAERAAAAAAASAAEQEGDDQDDEEYEIVDDMLADVDWELGSATNRYKAMVGGGQRNSNAGRVHSATYEDANFQPVERSKLFSKISVTRLDENTHEDLTKRVNQSVRHIVAKGDEDRVRRKDKADRATVEQVIDPRTRMILFKLLKNDYIQEIYGTISTGKEANVYHSVAGLTLDEIGKRERKPQPKQDKKKQTNTDKEDEELMLAARRAQAARCERLGANLEPEPEPEPEPGKAVAVVENVSGAERARAFLNGEIGVVRMKPAAEEEDGEGADGSAQGVKDAQEEEEEEVGQYMPEIAIKIFKVRATACCSCASCQAGESALRRAIQLKCRAFLCLCRHRSWCSRTATVT